MIANRDTPHDAIVRRLNRFAWDLGFWAHSTFYPGFGFPDVVIETRDDHELVVIEVKAKLDTPAKVRNALSQVCRYQKGTGAPEAWIVGPEPHDDEGSYMAAARSVRVLTPDQAEGRLTDLAWEIWPGWRPPNDPELVVS